MSTEYALRQSKAHYTAFDLWYSSQRNKKNDSQREKSTTFICNSTPLIRNSPEPFRKMTASFGQGFRVFFEINPSNQW